jgi:hypothetical protein
MKKVFCFFVVLGFALNLYSQDSIVNYLDRNGKVIAKKNASEIETIVRKDSLWKVTRYYRTGKLKEYGYFQDKEKKTPTGSFISYDRNGNLSSVLLYDSIGNKRGPYKRWFDTGKISATGIYVDNKKESIWKYYHYNGNIACKQYFKNDGITKTVIYDENGDRIETGLVEFTKPEYQGGVDEFIKRLRRIHNTLDYQVVGKIHLNFNINIDGRIRDVEITEKIPKNLERQIRVFLENTKGWKPAIHMNRRYPYNYEIPLNFSVVFNE